MGRPAEAKAPSADVGITKTHDSPNDQIQAGGSITWTIGIVDNGPSGAPGIGMIDYVPAVYENVVANATVPDKCTVTPQVGGPHDGETLVQCDVKGIGQSPTDTITLTATLKADTPSGPIAPNCATLTYDTNAHPDNNPDNNSSCETGLTVVECGVDLAITKTATDLNGEALPNTPLPNTVVGNTDFLYHIHLINNGTGTATNATVSDTLPSGTAYVSDTGSCTGASPGDLGATLACNEGNLGPAGTADFDVRVTAVNSGPLTNSASATSDENCDKNSQDNTSSVDVNVSTVNIPVALEADREGCPGGDLDCVTTVSDLNRVFEPNETARVDPSWKNTLDNADSDVTGTASLLTGPGDGSTAIYTIEDSTADYGTIAAGATADCNAATGDCYGFTITQTGGTRPHNADHPRHWDATFHEALNTGETFDWQLHLGDSFTDVPRANIFYRFVETIFHNHITVGCLGGNIFCPADPTTRQEMAAFISRSILLKDVNIPVTTADYNCANVLTPVAGQFVDVPATNGFCKHANYLKTVKVTLGCTDALHFCPLNNVLRGEMAVFIARAYEYKASLTPGPATTDPDGDIPTSGTDGGLRSYDCTTPGGGPFLDVLNTSPVCKHVGFLWVTFVKGSTTQHIIDGDGAGHFLPNNNIRRDETSKILANAFGDLPLYGPLTF